MSRALRAAAAIFHQSQDKPRMITWAIGGYELVKGRFDITGDHGGFWETSLLMALDPGMQDLGLLEPSGENVPVGISNNGVRQANAAFGEQAVAAIVDEVEKRVRHFLDHPDQFQGHGSPM
jgi:creatinine amidohydrolase/Fe(II)-dependent formamide hydrolase-like protein